jgi:hypothetical protein
MEFRGLLLAGAVALASPYSALAQADLTPQAPKADVSFDQRVQKALAERRGVVLTDVRLSEGFCGSTEIYLRNESEAGSRPLILHGSSWFFRAQTRHGSIAMLKPGAYSITHVICRNGNDRSSFNGPHARFNVNAGEVVDLGVLRLEVSIKTNNIFTSAGKGNMHRSIRPTPPEMREDAAKKIPSSIRRMVVRHMALMGPVDSAVTRTTRTR